jgi:hypothetical protein
VALQVLGLVSIDIFILLLWTFVERPRGITYESTAGGLYAPIQLTVCSTNLSSPFERAMVAWKAILLAAGVYKSICTWDMPSDIAEVSTHLTYGAVDCCTVTVPVRCTLKQVSKVQSAKCNLPFNLCNIVVEQAIVFN